MKSACFAVALLASSACLALDPPAPPAHPAPAASSDFLYYHPDLDARHDGLEAYSHQHYAYALGAFLRGARYADKPSQAMLASMYWDGKGVERDRATAYAWADLAAERGYPWLLATRERYWQEMTADERQRALAVGQALYAQYGDEVAQSRLNGWLYRGLTHATGSRTGFVGTLEVRQGNGFGVSATGSDGNDYYAARYWRPEQYWGAQNLQWNPHPQGKVSVGPLEKVPARAASPGDDANKPTRP